MNTPWEQLASDEHLFKEIRVADATRDWFNTTPMGQAFKDRANSMYLKAVRDFEQLTDSQIMEDTHVVLEIKRTMDLARAFIVWVNDIIVSGDKALYELHERDDADGADA